MTDRDRLPTKTDQGKSLWSGSKQPSTEVAAFLDQLKAKSESGAIVGRGRLIIALDATQSREKTWDAACHITGEMFEATAALGGIAIQLAYYRGFDECKASNWFRTAVALHNVMRAVTCLGGQTQIERILRHAINKAEEQPVSALVFIGDAMEEEADLLCGLAGKLGALSVPIFCFHEGFDPIAGACFRQMAALSKGAYLPFDLASIGRLKELLGAIAVYAAAGLKALENYSAKHQGNTEVLRITAQLKR